MEKLAQGLQKCQKDAKIVQNMIFFVNQFQYHKLLWNGLEQGWKRTDNIQTDEFGPMARPRMSEMGPRGSQKVAEIG